MRGFPKKIATGTDLYNCLSLVQAGSLPAADLNDAIAAVEEREYITVPALEVSADRKTVIINPCAEAAEGAKIKNNYSTTISESRKDKAERVRAVFEEIASGVASALGDAFTALGFDVSTLAVDDETGDGEADSGQNSELMIVTLSRALQEGENAIRILSEKSPYDALGITSEEVKSIKGVLKNYEISDK